MDDPASWACSSASQTSDAQLGDVAVAEHAVAGQLVQGRAGDQLADQQRAMAVDAELEQGDDAVVVEASGGMGLAGDAIGVADHDLLHGDVALQALVVGPVHRAHSPGADPLLEEEPIHHQLSNHSCLQFAARGAAPARDLGRSRRSALGPEVPSAAGFILSGTKGEVCPAPRGPMKLA